MKGKRFIKKIVAVAVVLCMFVPFLTYVDFSSLFHSDKVSAATIDAAGVGGVTATKTTTADGRYYTTIYQENVDTNGDGITDSYINIAENPSSQYYTKYRKAEYYRTGNVNAYGQTPSIDNHSFDMMVRYDGSGNLISNLKTNKSAKSGSDSNPIVLVEIVPEAMVTQLSMMFAGEEAFDLTYASFFADAYTFTTYKASATNENGLPLINQQGINDSSSNSTSSAGVLYNKNTFLKEVYGYGYTDCKPTKAPLVDQYQFVGWYLGDASGQGYFNSNLYSDENKVTAIGNWPSTHSWSEFKNGDLHLYARWQYKYYVGSYGGNEVWYDAPYTNLVDSSIDVTVDGTDIDMNGNGVIDGDEVSIVNFANKVAVNSVTFHLVKPSGTGVAFTNAKGTFTGNDVTAQAAISFANDYDFSSGVIGGSYPKNSGGLESWVSVYEFPYPSLMGNTDYKIKTSNECNVQVVVMTAQELTDALSNGTQNAYIELLSSADMVYLENKQYTALYSPLASFVNSICGSSVTTDSKLNVARNIINTGLNKDFTDATKLTALVNNNFNSSVYLSSLDIEGYVAETMFKNMAGINSSSKEIPVVFDMTAATANGKQNIQKLYWLSVMNNDATQTYNDWYNDGHPFVLKDRDASELSMFPCAKQTLALTHFVSGVGELTNWVYYSVLPSKTKYAPLSQITDDTEHTSLVTRGYFDNDNRGNSGQEQLTYNFMTYRGDKAILQSFLHDNYSRNDYTKDGFEYLENEGIIDGSTDKTTTGWAFRFLMNATGGRKDEIVIANQNATGTDESGTVETAIVTNIVGSGIQDIVYYIDTNIGTEYYIRYYKVSSFKNTLERTLAASNVVAEYEVTADPAAVTADMLITYKVLDDDTLANDGAGNVPNEVVTGYSWGGNTLATALKYTKPGNSDRYGSMGKLSVTVQNPASAGSSDKYVIVAYHENGRNVISKYVEVSKARLPFSLD